MTGASYRESKARFPIIPGRSYEGWARVGARNSQLRSDPLASCWELAGAILSNVSSGDRSRDLEAELAALSRAEKAAVVQRLALDLGNTWPGIEATPGVAGGEARIVRTRIPVWVLVNYRRLGWSEARVLENFPELRAADLVQAWAYAESHREEIDKAIAENEAA